MVIKINIGFKIPRTFSLNEFTELIDKLKYLDPSIYSVYKAELKLTELSDCKLLSYESIISSIKDSQVGSRLTERTLEIMTQELQSRNINIEKVELPNQILVYEVPYLRLTSSELLHNLRLGASRIKVTDLTNPKNLNHILVIEFLTEVSEEVLHEIKLKLESTLGIFMSLGI